MEKCIRKCWIILSVKELKNLIKIMYLDPYNFVNYEIIEKGKGAV
jgi:hypothetical protein